MSWNNINQNSNSLCKSSSIIKALEYEFKWKYDLFKTFFKFFLNMISDLKIWFSRSYISSLLLLFHSKNMTPKNCLTYNFSLGYQYILQPTVWRVKKLIGWTASNWRNISFSKNISWDICYICKGDLVRSWKLKA